MHFTKQKHRYTETEYSAATETVKPLFEKTSTKAAAALWMMMMLTSFDLCCLQIAFSLFTKSFGFSFSESKFQVGIKGYNLAVYNDRCAYVLV